PLVVSTTVEASIHCRGTICLSFHAPFFRYRTPNFAKSLALALKQQNAFSTPCSLLSKLQLASNSIPNGCQSFSSRYLDRVVPVARSRINPSTCGSLSL